MRSLMLTQRVNETNSNPVIIGALHGPYDSSLIGHVATTRMVSGRLLPQLKGHSVWMSVVSWAMPSKNKSLNNEHVAKSFLKYKLLRLVILILSFWKQCVGCCCAVASRE